MFINGASEYCEDWITSKTITKKSRNSCEGTERESEIREKLHCIKNGLNINWITNKTIIKKKNIKRIRNKRRVE